MTDATRTKTIEGSVDRTPDLLASPARAVLPNSGPSLPESADAAVATWLELIDRYFQVNRVPADHPHGAPDTPII